MAFHPSVKLATFELICLLFLFPHFSKPNKQKKNFIDLHPKKHLSYRFFNDYNHDNNIYSYISSYKEMDSVIEPVFYTVCLGYVSVSRTWRSMI